MDFSTSNAVRTDLKQRHDSDLEEPIEARDRALQRQKVLATIADRIRRSLDLETIFQTTVEEVRPLIGADRVVVYRFEDDWGGRFVAESVGDNWIALLDERVGEWESAPEKRRDVSKYGAKNMELLVTDTYLQETRGEAFARTPYRICNDVREADFTECYARLLRSYQAKAYGVFAVYQGDRLWGLFAAYQNAGPRHWNAEEIDWMAHIATQLGIAVQQAGYLERMRSQASKLEKLKAIQTRAIQNEKMIGLGELVAGVAHEISNPASFIHGNLKYLEECAVETLGLLEMYQQEFPEPGDAIRERIEELDLPFIIEDLPKTLHSMQMGTDRIRHLVLSLRNFSRLDDTPVKAVDLHAGIDSTLVILQHRLKARDDRPAITVTKEYGDLPPIECFPAQLNQIFMNLLSNSIDALEEAAPSSPVIRIRTEAYKGKAIVSVADNGPGIAEEILPHIFDPFFTTKEPGKGTGLGLSISYQIVEKHDGRMWCERLPAGGTETFVEIPTHHPDEDIKNADFNEGDFQI